MSMLGTKDAVFEKTRTKQAFKDETDINKLIQRAEKTGTISHLNKHEARYGDFSGFDFFEAQLQLSAGATIFAELPAELRSEFNQSPAQFFDYVNDPANKDRLGQLLPALAEPGRQLPVASGVITADADTAAAAAETPAPEGSPQTPGEPSGELPPGPTTPPEGGSSDST